MDFGLSEEQKSFIKEIDEFCTKECSHVDIAQLEEAGTDSEDIELKLVEKGWYGLPFPAEYGGLERSVFDLGLLVEGLARGGYPYPGRFQITMLNALNVFENGSETQKKEILPKAIRGEVTLSISVTEPNAGSDIASLVTKAVPKDGGYSITGQKVYSSGASGEKNIIIVATRTDPAKQRHKGLTLFLVPSRTKGLEFRLLKSLGRRIGGLYEVFFDEAWVPEENILGGLNDGWTAMTKGFNLERAIVSAGYLGFAKRIFDDILKLVQRRSCNNRLLSNYGAVSQQVAEFATEIQAAQLLTYRSLCLADEGKSAIEEVSQNKVYCSELVKRLGDFGMEITGGLAYLMDSTFQWYFRESKIVTIGGGSSQIMRSIAGAALGLKAK